ncbi:MAG: hydrogenase maturation protease [Phycisphaeraceae bacterium]|nr:hydrogenase maturation protease [Phycisphaeraceae bacterium]
MSPVLIIGYGSTLRGDDALGPMVAERLEEMLGDCVTVEIRQSLTPELTMDISQAELVLFIDCSVEGKPGTVRCRRVTAGGESNLAMVHFLDPSGMMTWTKKLYGGTPRAYTLSATGATFDFGEELSPAVAEAMPKLIDKALSLIEKSFVKEPACHA